MSKEKRRVPKLRFPGFTEDWEQRKLGDFYTFKNGLNKEKVYFGYGDSIVNFTDVFHNRQIYSSTLKGKVFVNKKELENFKVKEGDLFFTRTSETIDEIGFPAVVMEPMEHVVFSGFVLRGRAEKNDPLVNIFKSYIFFTDNFRSEMKKKSSMTTRALTSGTALKEMYFSYPKDLEEQTKIGEILLRLDNVITLHQRKLDNLKLKKKALLQKLFPKNGERYPELRFPGFTDAWEQRKLESLFTKYEDKVNTPSSGYWRLGLRSHCKGTFHTYIDAGNELEIAEMNRVKSGNFILNITFAWERALAVTNDEDQDKLVSHRFPQFKPNNDLVIDFFKHTLTDKRFKHHLELSSPGGAGRNKVLKVADMLKYELLVPSIKEQNEISSFLNHVDYIITLHQRKLDHLQLQKKALLQQMFV